MNFLELKERMSNYNKTHEPRFILGDDGISLKIGTYSSVFNFTETDFRDAKHFVQKFGMLKEDSECLGDELYYKGLKWNELTDKQRKSVIDSYKYAGKRFIKDESRYESLFESNRCFIEYVF